MEKEKDTMKKKEKTTVGHKILTAVGIVLCAILIPILIINITLIIKGYTNSDEVPRFGDWVPMIVLTDSMKPVIKSGDLIICHTAKPDSIKKGDVITFFDPQGDGDSVVTHRVTEIIKKDNNLSFRTKGDANNAEDLLAVPQKSLIGVYQRRIPKLGSFALFLSKPMGLVLCVILPLVLLIAYDIIRRRLYDKKNNQTAEELLMELEKLKAEKEEQDV